MARDKPPKLELKIFGIPEKWIPPNEEIKLNMKHGVRVDGNGNKRIIVFDDSKFVKEVLRDFCGIG